jgi:hypothetical protein
LGIGNRADFTKQIENLAMTDYAKYQDVVKFLDPTQNMNLENIGTGEALARELYTRFGLDLGDTFGQAVDAGGVQSRTAEDILAQLGLEPGSLAAVKTALEQFSENLTNALSVTDMSVTASSVSVSGVPGDTSTPRYGRMGDTPSSRFRSTYVNHSYFDSLISGKRTMTSGVRDFALGSINSDHVTGRALDLTGQNLGMYKTSIEAAGGFAEFHGSNASRHLHVVPPNGPVGDASTPVAASVNNNVGIMSGGGSGSSGQYVININGYNKTPQQLANEVLAVMRTNERSMKERRGG